MSQKKNEKTEKRYPAAVLLKSNALSGYQKDFAKVILAGKSYTAQEAVEALNKALNPGKNVKKKGVSEA